MKVALVLTHNCNLGCPYCYAGRKFDKEMPRDVAEAAIDLATFDKPDSTQISFFGGEPLLAFDLMGEYTELAKDRLGPKELKMRFVVTTNGTGFNEERLEYLRNNNFFVGLSIDGVEEAHNRSRPLKNGKGSFKVVSAGLESLIRARVDFETISVIDPSNVQFLGETVRFLVDAGVRRISLNPNFAADWSDDDLEAWHAGYEAAGEAYLACFRRGHLVYINIIDDKVITHLKGGYKCHDRCEFGRASIAVAPSGNIYPCERLVGEDEDHEFVIGNVFDGFAPRRNDLLQIVGNTNDDCPDCALNHRCMNWCACANYADTGQINVSGGIVCWHEKTAIAVADDVAAQLYKEQNPMFLQNYYLR